MATSDAGAYYALVSRLRLAELPFDSVLPSSHVECDLVLTTREEARGFRGDVLVLEELDASPGVFKGQLVSRLEGGSGLLLAGVDPGKRIGLAVFYDRVNLAFSTLDDADAVCESIGSFVAKVPSKQLLVRVGGGNRALALGILQELMRRIPTATLELVNESGTSVGSSKMKGIQRDQVAAAKIAFRKGVTVGPGWTRSRD